jgi:KipI family sensor histidine kinase inhibitor|tara:strand:- start:1519 stop:2211 length:693 start_codon:yes stop_codon:yes gene_type:complete
MNSPFPYIQVAGENSVVIYFGDVASAEISAQVQQCADLTDSELGAALIDIVPSYASLLVIYNVLEIDHLAVNKVLRKILSNLEAVKISDGKVVLLPVYYSTESGPDLELLANNAGLSVDDVIAIHQSQEYRVYAIGFAPGFAYLGEVDKRIAAARLATPRQKVPRGAVGIADRQTAVYPAVSPGGWNLIGLCPQRMFDPVARPTMPVAVGDRVKFDAISRDEFLALGGEL